VYNISGYLKPDRLLVSCLFFITAASIRELSAFNGFLSLKVT